MRKAGLTRFQEKILDFYAKNKRDLPWRHTRDPYKILVSEVMLQQTQVSRVLEKYKSFVKLFPNFQKLARAPQADIVRAWQGLGYNRRALALRRLAGVVMKQYRGTLPRNPSELKKLPGIGPYTAAAIAVFAFNQPLPMLETNIRRVYIHEFFPTPSDSPLHLRGSAKGVSDQELLPLIEKTLDRKNPREWYFALMDYGAMLGKTISNPNRRSVHYARQSKFEGSDRQIRGAILRILSRREHAARAVFMKLLDFSPRRIIMLLAKLTEEGLIVDAYGTYRLA